MSDTPDQIQLILKATLDTDRDFYTTLNELVVRAGKQEKRGIHSEVFAIYTGAESGAVTNAYELMGELLLAQGNKIYLSRPAGFKIGSIKIPGTKWIRKFKEQQVNLAEILDAYAANSISVGQKKESKLTTYGASLRRLNDLHGMITTEVENGRTIVQEDQRRITEAAVLSVNPVDYEKLRKYDPEVHGWVLSTTLDIFTHLFDHMIRSVPMPTSGDMKSGKLTNEFLEWIIDRNLKLNEADPKFEDELLALEHELAEIVDKKYNMLGEKKGEVQNSYALLKDIIHGLAPLSLFEHGPYLWLETMELEAVRKLVFQAHEHILATGTNARSAYQSNIRASDRLKEIQNDMTKITMAMHSWYKSLAAPEDAEGLVAKLPGNAISQATIEGVGDFPTQIVQSGKLPMERIIPGYVRIGDKWIDVSVLGVRMQGIYEAIKSDRASEITILPGQLKDLQTTLMGLETIDPFQVDRFTNEINDTKINLLQAVEDYGNAALLFRIAHLKLRTMEANTQQMADAVTKAYSGHAIEYAVTLASTTNPAEKNQVILEIVKPFAETISGLPARLRTNANSFINDVAKATAKVANYTARMKSLIEQHTATVYAALPQQTYQKVLSLLPPPSPEAKK